MKDARRLFFVVIGAVVLGFGIMLVIYFTQGEEGESTDIPTNPDALAQTHPGVTPSPTGGQPRPLR